MAEKSGIEWTDATWNPWYGCTKVSPGCDNCYMFREMKRYGRDPDTVTRSKTKFDEPLKWKEPRMVFTCSWSDFFHVTADEWRAEAWRIIKATPHLTYQILTKRPALMARRLPPDWGDGYPNVWLIVSAEDQTTADQRIPVLLATPAALRGVSAEPLLGPIDFDSTHESDPCTSNYLSGIAGERIYDGQKVALDWIIVGGESGPGHRPMELDWAASIVGQCKAAGVACFVKQLGGWPDKRGKLEQFPPALQVREYPAVGAK